MEMSIDLIFNITKMKGQEKITFDQIKSLREKFNQGLENFDIKNYPNIKKIISDIQEEIELLFMISEDRHHIRLGMREIVNKKIKEENEIGLKKAIPNYIAANAEEFLKNLEKVGVKIDTRGGLHAGKFKKGTYIKDFIFPNFQEKELIKDDHYIQIRKELENKAKIFISQLQETLEDAKSKSENLFQNYDNINQLLLKLGIQAQIRSYDLFSKGTGTPRPKGEKMISDEEDKVAPSFKKIGYLFKYFQDNKITLQSRHILKYPDGSLCIYIQSKNITILISDEVGGNKCFRDATYIVKGPILEDKPITKDMIGEYEGKRIMFSDTRGNRLEEVLTQNPNTRDQIKTQNGTNEDLLDEKELITDKEAFINIIKDNFTMDSLDGTTYSKFIIKYNADPKNPYLLRSTLQSNYALLGIMRSSSTQDIINTIRNIKSHSVRSNRSNFMGNDAIKEELKRLREYSDFDSKRDLGNTSYGYRLLNILKIAISSEDSNDIKLLSAAEKQKKIAELTGMMLPLTGQTLSIRLGGMPCSTKEYQQMLRERFCMYSDGQNQTKKYIELCLQIQESEKEYLDAFNVHSKSPKKQDNISHEVNDGITTAFETPKIKKLSKNKEGILKELTINDIEKYEIYKGKIYDSRGDNMYIRLDNSQVIGTAFNRKKKYKIGDEVEVIVSDIRTSLKDETKHLYLIIKKYDGQEKDLKFCDSRTFGYESIIIGSQYTGVVNNITETKVWVSLSKNCSGFINKNEISNIDQIKVGSKLRVKFIRRSGNMPVFKFA